MKWNEGYAQYEGVAHGNSEVTHSREPFSRCAWRCVTGDGRLGGAVLVAVDEVANLVDLAA